MRLEEKPRKTGEEDFPMGPIAPASSSVPRHLNSSPLFARENIRSVSDKISQAEDWAFMILKQRTKTTYQAQKILPKASISFSRWGNIELTLVSSIFRFTSADPKSVYGAAKICRNSRTMLNKPLLSLLQPRLKSLNGTPISRDQTVSFFN